MDLLRCAAQQGGDEIKNAGQRYQEAIQVWKEKFAKAQERSFAGETRDLWRDFCAMQRSDDGRQAYVWETDQFVDKSN